MFNVIEGGKVPIKAWTNGVQVEDQARQQLVNLAQMPFIFRHVAAMPDVHWGMGATVGSVIATRGAIIPAAVGVDIGCFVGETKIPLLDGTQKTLKEMHDSKGVYWVYSIDKSGAICPGKAISLKTRSDAALVRVIVSGGDEILCTPDHQFMLNDGSYKEAQHLDFNDSLMPLYRKWQTRDGYESVSNGRGKARLTHLMVWEYFNGPIPANRVVHHKDHIHFNNVPDNLEAMTASEHSFYHRSVGYSFNNADTKFQELRRAGIAARVADPAALRWHKGAVHGFNHKVISVTPVEHVADVYCLSVEEHHNFAVAAGVFVHNCGMAAQRTSLTASDLPDNLFALRSEIERRIPHGRTNNGREGDRGAWENPPEIVLGVAENLSNDLKVITDKHPRLHNSAGRSHKQLGTLGTGNHFVEVCIDEEQQVWVMLHSGSRGIGNAIGTYFIEKAKEDMRRWFINLPDADLAYIPQGSELFKDYCEAVEWAQGFALSNRNLMMDAALDALRAIIEKPFRCDEAAVNCHHNYVTWEHHFGENVMITRKGAVNAREGVMGIIPGSMGAKSFIVRGKGNPESFHSCSHGAGRAMSRNAAKKKFTLEDHAKATEGVECRKDADVIDETPGAYKDIDAVMAAQSDLVDIVHTLKQVLCVKG